VGLIEKKYSVANKLKSYGYPQNWVGLQSYIAPPFPLSYFIEVSSSLAWSVLSFEYSLSTCRHLLTARRSLLQRREEWRKRWKILNTAMR